MRATVAVLGILVMIGAGACGESSTPTAPAPVTGTAATAPLATPEPSSLGPTGIAEFSMTGQRIQGVYHYWPSLLISAGRDAIVIKSLVFTLPGVTLTRDRADMSWPVSAGGTYRYDRGLELLGDAAGPEAIVTMTYTTADGHSQQVSATTAIPPIAEAPASAALAVSSFVVTRWRAQNEWGYWPRLTMTETTGRAAVTITRIEFALLDVGIHGRVPPTRGTWHVPAGGTIDVFDEWSYGEPELYLTSSQQTDRVMVTLSYVDEHGRPGDVTATAQVTDNGLPPVPQ